ncbi:MAG: TonB-dependent receptor [Bacteroidota bacterium]|nr:vitamin B12 receptor [Odoribacter sp.]MDP3643613.1 TonB-dependent receptor [Bacteroidota bacterium]
MKKIFRSINRAEMFTFKRWGGKSYSLFNAIKKPVHIGVLLAVYTTVAEPEYVFAQTDSSKVSMEYNLDEVQVGAQRAPVAFSQVARIVSVINREEIEAAPVQSIQELLEYALSVDVRQRGVHGVQADISVRGGSFDQTLILLNGINISDPQTGHHALNLPVSLKNIQRIEILEGPAARVFGPNAFSGAINIITSSEGNSSMKIDVSTGQHKLADINLSGNLKTGDWNQFAAFNRMSSNGYIDNTDFKTWNAFYQTKLNTKPGTLDFQVGRTNKAFGANSFYTATYPNQYEETKTTFASLKFESGTKIHLIPSVYWRRHQDRFELFRTEPASWYKGHNYHLTDVFGSNLNAWFASKFGKTAFGAEIRTENVWSNVLGEVMATPIKAPGEDNQFFTKSYSRTTISYFAEHSIYLEKFTLSAGAMTNWISDLGFGWNIYPGLDASLALSDHLKIYGSASTSLRMPTFTDLFYSGPTNLGNPDLKPEKSVNYEGGIKFNYNGFSGHAGSFHRKGEDLIDWVREKETDKWQTKNLTKINSTGIEVSGKFFPEKIWNKNLFITKLGLNYSYIYLDKGGNNFFSNYVLDNLKHKFDLELNHKIRGNLKASWRVSYQDRNGMRTKSEPYNPFWLVNTRLMWKTPSTEIYAMAANLFDTKYYDLGVIEQPGRWISFGINYQIKFK